MRNDRRTSPARCDKCKERRHPAALRDGLCNECLKYETKKYGRAVTKAPEPGRGGEFWVLLIGFLAFLVYAFNVLLLHS